MTNIAEILKDCPAGTKLYSLLFGEGTFVGIENEMFIIVETKYCRYRFDEYGKLSCYPAGDMNNGECLLFPSKDHRTWIGFKFAKFKVGDWIVYQDGSRRIYNITDISCGRYVYDNNGKYDFISVADESCKLWDIQDAEDGDVLYSLDSKQPFIFKERPLHSQAIAYCGINKFGSFFVYQTKECVICLDKYVPATKEQRDRLFAEMKEAGYEWDAEKKELKKIQPHYEISNFKAGMSVLVRDDNEEDWVYGIFSHYCKNIDPFVVCCSDWRQCIPYEGNEALLGTTDMCDECYINW